MATPSDVVVLKSSHITAVHVISSFERTDTLGHSHSIAANSCTDATKKVSASTNAQVTCSKHSDSFQNIFGIDGYLRRRQLFPNNSVYNINNSTSDSNSASIADKYCSRKNNCLQCEEENNMNNNINNCNHSWKAQEVSQEVNDVYNNHKVCNFVSEIDGSCNVDSDIQSRILSNPEKYYEELHVECPKTEFQIHDRDDSENKETGKKKIRPFSLSGEDQISHKQNAFGVGCIPLLGLSSGTKMKSNIFSHSKSVETSEYSHTSSPLQLSKQNGDSKQNDLKEHYELGSLILNRNCAGLLKEYAGDPQENMSDSGEDFRRDDTNAKENCFHPVDAAIRKMTLHKAQKITSFDSCTCINPGNSHACATRAPTYGILNPLFDDSLRHSFLEGNASFDKWKSLKISEKPSSSSFEPMNLWLPPLANAPNTQGLSYYLPYSLPSFSNAPINSSINSLDSIFPMSSEKVESSVVHSLPKSLYITHDASLTQMARKGGMKSDLIEPHLSDNRKEFSSKPKNKGRRESGIAKDRLSFLSPASGEITLPYTPPDMQEELMFPNASYGKGTEIIQNLNAQENDFILGRPTRTPRANDSFGFMKGDDGDFSKFQSNEHSTKNLEKTSLTGHKPDHETCMTGVTKFHHKTMTQERNVETSNGVSRPRKLEDNDSSDIPSVRQKNKHRLLDKTLSLPVDIPLKLDNFDRDDYVSYKKETHAIEINIPHCLRLNCLDPCKEGLCLNSIAKSNSFANFSGLSERATDNGSNIVDVNLSQRRSSDSYIYNRTDLEKCNISDKLKGPGISLNKKEEKQDKFAYQTVGKKIRFIQQRSILHEEVELEDVNRDPQQKVGHDKRNLNKSDSRNASYEQHQTRKHSAPFDDEQSRISPFESHGTSDGVPPSKQELKGYTRRLNNVSDVKENSLTKHDIKVNDCQQSSFSSEDGAAHSAGSASQESSDNSNESRKSLSLLDRRRNAANRKDKLKLQIADRSSSEKINEVYELGTHFLRNVVDKEPVVNIANCKIQGDSQISRTEDHSHASLVDDVTNYWLDSPSPNSLEPSLFPESPGELSPGTNTHSITKYPEASGFSKNLYSTSSNKISTNSVTKRRKRCRAVTTNSALTVFENPVSMANYSPDSDKTLTREIVKNIIEEKRSRSKSNSASSPIDLQTDPTHTTRESERHCKRETHLSPDAKSSVPYEPLVTPSPMTPCGGFLEGSTPLLPGGSGKTFPTSVDLTNHGMAEDSTAFYADDVRKSSDERITLQTTGCLESSGAISKRSPVPKPSDRPKRLHNRPHDSHRPHHPQHSRSHNHKGPPSSSSSSDEASSSDSSSSDTSSSSGSSSSSSESSSDLEDIVHLRP